jgi:hypothetical protein
VGKLGKSSKHPSADYQSDTFSLRTPHSTLRAIAGVAVAGLVAGPFMAMYVAAFDLLWRGSISAGLSSLPSAMALTSLCSLPVAIVNGVVLGTLARQGKDSLALALCSGGMLGIIVEVAFLMIEGPPIIYDAPEWLAWLHVMKELAELVLTGISMSIPQWWIAIRPSRQFRLGGARDEEAIRAMS